MPLSEHWGGLGSFGASLVYVATYLQDRFHASPFGKQKHNTNPEFYACLANTLPSKLQPQPVGLEFHVYNIGINVKFRTAIFSVFLTTITCF